jgi:hypothetical protein
MALLGICFNYILLLRAVTNSVDYSSRVLIGAKADKKVSVIVDPNNSFAMTKYT